MPSMKSENLMLLKKSANEYSLVDVEFKNSIVLPWSSSLLTPSKAELTLRQGAAYPKPCTNRHRVRKIAIILKSSAFLILMIIWA